ncbi:hypothetical protein JK361_08075 [Streptomyces sp. 5-8]|uniref:Clp R domain-containing protein n=1 Tax=Streptomyces musisoli TaxID=2802280 RepID=A0ABS1NWT0_9ACTN|nr:hypothetical protein [Streptomyces musisoli]MBL1104553.1 hypothetical protein [Streptomyces musisoli]
MELVTPVAGALARALLGPVGARIGRVVLGPAERRALEKACRAALERAVGDLREEGATREEADHVLGLLQRLMEEVEPEDMPLFAPLRAPDPSVAAAHAGTGGEPGAPDTERTGAVLVWRQAAERAGQDPDTFPMAFDHLVERLFTHMRAEVTEAAATLGSPLFPRVVLTRLERLDTSFRALVAAVHTAAAPLIPLAEPLRQALDTAREVCRTSRRAFVTPDLLLALLSIPYGRTAACFDSVRPALADTVRHMLQRYLTTTEFGPFHPFDWAERADVQHARGQAARDGAPVVSDAHLLLGVLEGESATNLQLARWLGPDHGKLRRAALAAARGAPPAAGTPGTVFGDGDPFPP